MSTYPIILTIVHYDGTSILSLYNSSDLALLVWRGLVVPYKITWYGLQLIHSGVLVYSVSFAVS
jgi:hypothetical protein